MMIFDGHSDLWEDVDEKRRRGLKHIIPTIHEERWREGNICGGFYPIWVNPYSSVPVNEQAQSIIQNMCSEEFESGRVIQFVTNYTEYESAVTAGIHAAFLGAEGLSFIGQNTDLLYPLYKFGFRHASLTWNEENELATGASGDPLRGLTEAGEKCIRRMEGLNMIVDLAHANEKTFWDAAEIISQPFVISHGNCKGLCDHSRNLSDSQLDFLAEKKGVAGISAYPLFLSENSEKWTVSTYVDHIEYAVNRIGIDYVGLGFDIVDFLDDAETDPSLQCRIKGFASLRETENIVGELKKRGFTVADIKKICHDNFIRVIKDVLL